MKFKISGQRVNLYIHKNKETDNQNTETPESKH